MKNRLRSLIGRRHDIQISPERDVTEFPTVLAELYGAFFGRQPDEATVEAYRLRVSSGMSMSEIVHELSTSPEFKDRTRNKLFVPPGHFYSPIVNREEAEAHFSGLDARPISEHLPGIKIDRSEMLALWDALLPHMLSNPFPDQKGSTYRYAFDNMNYSIGDGSVWHAMLLHLRPRRVVEIGSGWSSANLIDTVEHYLDSKTEITFVEPYPQLLRDLIGTSVNSVEIFEMPVQNCDLDVFRRLQAGDILFIDSTHILRTGSDVCFELFEIMPVLADGVIVHFHDMFWPFEYLRPWVIDDNRSWNELYAVRAFLTDNPSWEILMFNDYLAKTAADHVSKTYPRFLENPGGGLYLRKQPWPDAPRRSTDHFETLHIDHAIIGDR